MFPAPRLGFLRLIGLLLCVMKLSKAFSVSGGKRLSLLRPGHRLVGNGLWMYQRRSISIITSTNLSVRHRIMNLSDLHVSMRANTKLFSSIERSKQLPLQPHIDLTPEETELFDTILRFVDETKLNTTVRVAGGWVRDKVLQLPSKFDIDIALENMTGVQFATQMQQWLESTKNARMLTFSVIEQNTEKSKHLETVTGKFGKLEVDIVNLRTESYTKDSRIPQMEIGTPLQDVLRRDLTINTLFYNLHTRQVEDLTGRGLNDLQAGIVRTPLPALITLKDDPLRAFRVVRFACRFGFDIVAEAAQACRNKEVHDSLATKVSRERSCEELQLMFRSSAAARAVSLLHSFGLLQCLLGVPDGSCLYVQGDGAERSRTGAGSVAVAPAKALALQRDFLDIGVSTVLAEHYMHHEVTNSGNHLGGFPLCRSWLEDLSTSTDLQRLLITASLMSATQGYMYREMHSGGKKDRFIPLVEQLLAKQIKMSNKDTAAIMRTMDSSVAFRSLLRSSTSSSSSSSSKYVPPILSAITATPASCPAGTAAAAASAAGRGGEGQDQCRVPIPVPTPTSVGALSRLQVGLAIRLAGEHYPYALYLAAAQELLDRLISMRSISSSCDGDDNADAVGSVVAGRSAAVIKEEGVYEKIISNLQVLGAIQTKTVEEEGDAKSDLSGPLDALAPTMPEFSLDESTKVAYEKELSVVLGAVETLLKSIQVMKAENSWAESASFSGHALMQAFPGAPKGPIISQMKDCQIEWKLENPNGTDDQLLTYMKATYANYM